MSNASRGNQLRKTCSDTLLASTVGMAIARNTSRALLGVCDRLLAVCSTHTIAIAHATKKYGTDGSVCAKPRIACSVNFEISASVGGVKGSAIG